MKKIWLMAKTTYKLRVRSGMFLVLTFGLPVLMIIAGAIPVILATRGGSLPPVGYVDETGRLAPITQVSYEEMTLNLTQYPDPDAAEGAFERGEIEGYLVIPEDYFDGGRARYYAEEDPAVSLEEALENFMRRAMRPEESEAVVARLSDPFEATYVASKSGEELVEGPALIIRVALPAGIALLISFAILTGVSQMGAAIVREKEQRAMEMIITSISSTQLVAGKVLGMTLLSLTQVAIWALGATIAALLFLSGEVDLASLSIPWEALVWALLLGVPGYFLFAVLASGLGILGDNTQQAQQMAGILSMVGLVPLWFAGVLVESPNSPFAVALTLFPLTSPMISLLRMAFTDLPLWQPLVGLVLILISLVASIWLVARIFRATMLMYGKSLRPQHILRALREA